MKRPLHSDLRSKVTAPLPHVIPDVENWPIYALSRDKERFLDEVMAKTRREFLNRHDDRDAFHAELKSILYQEKIRLTRTPWSSDGPHERDFWTDAKRRILLSSDMTSAKERYKEDLDMLDDILGFYTDEIVAHFDVKAYRLARTVLPWVYARLMNASPSRWTRFLSSSGKTVYDKIRIIGPVDHIRTLAKRGTLVVVPTHFSNLDSPTIGLTLEFMGLPAMTYGAGINLFTVKVLSYLMNNLGAYKVDRRRKNELYLEVLKNYSSVALQRGAHSLFFPGGTRSRSGSLEKKLKLGLLGTAIEAQRLSLMQFPAETARSIYIVPVTLNYHFVLEARNLIRQHLAMEGKEQYLIEDSTPSTSYTILKLLFKFLTATPGMTISFGAPMDVFGNTVDPDGHSIGNTGGTVELADYFSFNGEIREDKQRDAVYTRQLGDAILDSFSRHNTVLSSHLMAFTAFEMLQRRFPGFDLYQILRLPDDEAWVSYTEFAVTIERLRGQLIKLYEAGRVLLAPQIFDDVDKLIAHGLKNMGVYHTERVLYRTEDRVASEDLQLLYFYHNRLDGYDLGRHV